MSRTIRRRNRWLERRYVGTLDDIDERDIRLTQARDKQQAFEKRLARFHRCRKSGVWGSSTHYYRRQYYNVPERRLEALLCHLVTKGDLEDVMMPGRQRGANSSHLWSIT